MLLALIILILFLCMMLSSTLVVFAACILAKRQSNPHAFAPGDFSIRYVSNIKQKGYEHAMVHNPQETVYSLGKAR